jgi:glycine/sarcosine N-methyltransferase
LRAGPPGDPAGFYDELAADYHRIFPDWEASSARQGDALHAVISREIGPGPHAILDCAAGIGTQLLGLAAHGHRMCGTDISLGAIRRARHERGRRGAGTQLLGLAVADMRALPFAAGSFGAVVCADNSLPHLLRAGDVVRALGEMRRVVAPGGLVVVTTRDYDAARAQRPAITLPGLSEGPDGVTITLQLWAWHADGERYDLRHLQVIDDGGRWRVAERRTVYWAVTRDELSRFALDAGLAAPTWLSPDETGFFQQLMLARVPVSR